MKILLINPPYLKESIFRKSLKYVGATLPSLGLAYIAAVLEKEGNEVKIIDGPVLSTKAGYDYNSLKKDLKRFDPSVVGVTATSPQINLATKTLHLVKNILPDSITALGGPHITALPDIINEIKTADYGIYGEGELTFLEMTERIKKKKGFKKIKGVMFKGEKKAKFEARPYIQNLDDLPFPARHLLPMKLYRPSPANYRRLPATTIMTSRGCPYSCIYCHKPIFGNYFRPHSSRRVADEIEHLIGKYGIRDIQIFDDTFTLDKKRTEDICKEIIKRKLDIEWNCMTRVDRVSQDLLKLMKKAGCYEVGFGVESGSSRILKLIKKGVDKDTIRKAVSQAKKAHIDVRAFFMMGFPTETKKEIIETINFAKELNPDVAQFMVVSPYPDTELWDLAKNNGDILAEDWSNFTYYAPKKAPFIPNTLHKGELESLYARAYKRFYLRPVYIMGQLMKIKSFSDINRNLHALMAVAGI